MTPDAGQKKTTSQSSVMHKWWSADSTPSARWSFTRCLTVTWVTNRPSPPQIGQQPLSAARARSCVGQQGFGSSGTGQPPNTVPLVVIKNSIVRRDCLRQSSAASCASTSASSASCLSMAARAESRRLTKEQQCCVGDLEAPNSPVKQPVGFKHLLYRPVGSSCPPENQPQPSASPARLRAIRSTAANGNSKTSTPFQPPTDAALEHQVRPQLRL